MEFWGVEVHAGRSLKVYPGEGTLVHISHASLGNCNGKKGEAVTLNVKVGAKTFVMGTLVSQTIPQTNFDVLFDEEFELSHNWGKGSVHFVGFKCPNNNDDEGEDFSDSEEEEEVEVPANAAKANGKAAKAVAPEADDSDSDSEGMDEDGSDEEDEEDEETPKAETRMKRAHEPAPKTPVSAKKAKVEATPKKTEEKKKGGKTPAAATQSPKSASQVACGSCKKTFNSANALESHTKAKHSATAK